MLYVQNDVNDFMSGTENSTSHHHHYHCSFTENLHGAKYIKIISFNHQKNGMMQEILFQFYRCGK